MLESLLKNRTYRQVSDILGIDKSTLCKIRNKKSFPSSTTLKKLYIASGGKVTPNDVFPLNDWQKEM